MEAEVPEGAVYWKVKRVHHLTPDENRGNHNIYVNVYTGSDLPAWDEQVQMFWPDGTAIIPLEKPPPEAMGNGILGRNAIGVMVQSELESDLVLNLHTDHPDEPALPSGDLGNTNGHHSFLVDWVLTVKGTAEPPPVTGETLPEFIRRKSWDAVGVDFNPDAALFHYAQAHELGKPETNEFDVVWNFVIYRVQAYAGGIVYVEVGDWGNVNHVEWLI